MIVHLQLFTIGTKVTTVFCVQRKKIKFGLKLLLMETEQASSRKKAKHFETNIAIL